MSEDKIRAKTCQIAVGTPGRVKQLISEGLLSVDNVRLAALDEADKMLEPSFIKDTTWILNTLPATKQVPCPPPPRTSSQPWPRGLCGRHSTCGLARPVR